MFFAMLYRNIDLGTHGIHIVIHKGQIAMSSSTGYHLQFAHILEFFEGVDDISMIFFCKDVSGIGKMLIVHLRKAIKFWLMFCPFDLFSRKLDPLFKITDPTFGKRDRKDKTSTRI